MEEIMKDKVNVWDVIDTYFRDEPYYKSNIKLIHLMNLYFLKIMVFKILLNVKIHL